MNFALNFLSVFKNRCVSKMKFSPNKNLKKAYLKLLLERK